MHRIQRITDICPDSHPARTGGRLVVGFAIALALGAAGIVYGGSPDQDDEYLSDDMAQVLQEALQAGDLTDEEAREVYFEDVYPGSQAEAKTEGRLRRITAEIDAAVETGELSAEDAEGKYEWLREERVRSSELAFAVEVRGQDIWEAYLQQAAATLDAKVERGELSEEVAEARLNAMTEEIAAKEELTREVESGERTKSEVLYDHAAAKLDGMVERGEMSTDDAEAKLSEYGRQLETEEAQAHEDTHTATDAQAAKDETGDGARGDADRESTAKGPSAAGSPDASSEGARGSGPVIIVGTGSSDSNVLSPDLRTVLGAIRRVRLGTGQKSEIRGIRRTAIRAYVKIARKDTQAHTELAKQVKGEIVALLDGKQNEKYEAAIARLYRSHQQAQQRQQRRAGSKIKAEQKETP